MFYITDYAAAKAKFWNRKLKQWVDTITDNPGYKTMNRAAAKMDTMVHTGEFDTNQTGNLIHNSLECHSVESMRRRGLL